MFVYFTVYHVASEHKEKREQKNYNIIYVM